MWAFTSTIVSNRWYGLHHAFGYDAKWIKGAWECCHITWIPKKNTPLAAACSYDQLTTSGHMLVAIYRPAACVCTTATDGVMMRAYKPCARATLLYQLSIKRWYRFTKWYLWKNWNRIYMNILITNAFLFYLIKILLILKLIAWENALIYKAKATHRTGVTEFTCEALWFTAIWFWAYSVYNCIEWPFSFVFQEQITYNEQTYIQIPGFKKHSFCRCEKIIIVWWKHEKK